MSWDAYSAYAGNSWCQIVGLPGGEVWSTHAGAVAGPITLANGASAAPVLTGPAGKFMGFPPRDPSDLTDYMKFKKGDLSGVKIQCAKCAVIAVAQGPPPDAVAAAEAVANVIKGAGY
mmetsp:Transcript_29963/g.26529  ORF Transcript_29963/g.26529 Transcript_29963/m.26529 type:complete len:118 (+) Transcript_29963:11-364(+)